MYTRMCLKRKIATTFHNTMVATKLFHYREYHYCREPPSGVPERG
jgi:hypothetical protein